MNLIMENPKASVTVIAGAIVTLVGWILSFFGIMVPTEVAVALGFIFAALLARWTRISGEDAKVIKAVPHLSTEVRAKIKNEIKKDN